jgi:hypothetical protein
MSGITGGSGTANKVDVSTTFELQVVTPVTETQAGFVCVSSEVDAGSVLVTRTQRALEITDDYRARMGVDTPWANQTFTGIILSNFWSQVAATMTYAQATGLGVLNAANATASGNAITLSSKKSFPLWGTFGMHVEMQLREGNPTSTNSISEWGLGLLTGVATPLDGIFFRRLAGGQLQGVVNFAGAEAATVNITTTACVGRGGTGLYSATDVNKYVIVVANDETFFWINDILCGNIKTPSTQGAAVACTSLPVQFRCYNTGVASAARRIEIGFVNVILGDGVTGRDWQTVCVANGGGAYQTQPGVAVGPLTNSNVTALAAPVWAATTPAVATLGGKWISPSPLPAGTSGLATIADVHFPLFQFQNPATTAAIPGKDLIITGIRIGETVVSIVLGATYTQLEWTLGVGSTATAMTTADAVGPPTTVSPKRVHLGSQAFLATAPAGTVQPGFYVPCRLVVPPGAFVHIIASLFGNAATGALRGGVFVDGYFE